MQCKKLSFSLVNPCPSPPPPPTFGSSLAALLVPRQAQTEKTVPRIHSRSRIRERPLLQDPHLFRGLRDATCASDREIRSLERARARAQSRMLMYFLCVLCCYQSQSRSRDVFTRWTKRGIWQRGNSCSSNRSPRRNPRIGWGEGGGGRGRVSRISDCHERALALPRRFIGRQEAARKCDLANGHIWSVLPRERRRPTTVWRPFKKAILHANPPKPTVAADPF